MASEGHVVTGYQGVAHVSAADAGLFNAGLAGKGKYVLNTASQFHASNTSNTFTIQPGDLINQGRHISMQDTYSLTVENCEVGYQRKDRVVMRYRKDPTTSVETADLVLVKGEQVVQNPTVPTIISGNIFNGDLVDDFLLFGLDVSESGIQMVHYGFTVLKSIKEIQDATAVTTQSANITLSSGFTNNGAVRNYYHRVNNICMLGLDCTPTARVTNKVLCTLPSACRPIRDLRFSIMPGVNRGNYDDDGDQFLIIFASGQVQYTGSARIWETFTFFCNG